MGDRPDRRGAGDASGPAVSAPHTHPARRCDHRPLALHLTSHAGSNAPAPSTPSPLSVAARFWQNPRGRSRPCLSPLTSLPLAARVLASRRSRRCCHVLRRSLRRCHRLCPAPHAPCRPRSRVAAPRAHRLPVPWSKGWWPLLSPSAPTALCLTSSCASTSFPTVRPSARGPVYSPPRCTPLRCSPPRARPLCPHKFRTNSIRSRASSPCRVALPVRSLHSLGGGRRSVGRAHACEGGSMGRCGGGHRARRRA